MTSLRNIEPKLVVKLQPFGTERVKARCNVDPRASASAGI